MSSRQMIVMGRVSGLFGVSGWIKVFSHTEPREGILDYSPWYLKQQGVWQAHEIEAGHRQGRGVVAQLRGYDDRDQVAELIGCDIAVQREQLPELQENEYYWSDLQGLQVVNLEGVELGKVSHLFETGANDVVVVKGDRERLIPYTWGQAIRRVDLAAGLMVVDWDADF
ncbi:MAG: ribosome maturation factor RimM [Gammaproteobacteria bacterium]|nr:ribosome maturation factor RimM [Gammaproteobacteria bacterium]